MQRSTVFCCLIVDSVLHSFTRLLPWADFRKYTAATLTASSRVSRVIVMSILVTTIGFPGTLRGGDEEDVSVSG